MKTRTYLLVDGHSVLFAWPELEAQHRQHPARARELLLHALRTLHDMGQRQVIVVFDGAGESMNEVREPEGLQIFYAAANQTADEIIEKLCARYAEKHEITVATLDHAEQDTVRGFGAEVVEIATLRGWIESAQGDLERRLASE